MRLDIEQIKSITQGAERIEESNGSIRFYRFSAAEEAVYRTSKLFPRTLSTAGIKLHFTTDASSIRLKIRTVVTCYAQFFCMDVFADQTCIGTIQNYPEDMEETGYIDRPFENGEYSAAFALPSGSHAVEVYFPWSLQTELLELELENASFLEPVKPKKRFLLYGGSVSQGTAAQNPSETYGVKLSQWLESEFICKSVGSEVYFPELAECKSESLDPNYIMVAYGSNDWYNLSYEDARQRCSRFWKAICRNYPDAKKIALSPVWYRDHLEERPFGDFFKMEKMIRKVTEHIGGITFVRGWDLIPGDEQYFVDGIHPNNRGFQLFVEAIKEKIKKTI